MSTPQRRFARFSLVAETLRNLLAYRSLTFATMLIAGVAGITTVYTIESEISAIAQLEESHAEQGAYLWTIEAEGRKPLPAARCEALNSVDGVRAAGARIDLSPVYLAHTPKRSFWLERMTPGYALILWPDLTASQLSGPGVIVGDTIREEFGLRAGATVELFDAQMPPYRIPVIGAPSESARDHAADQRFAEIQAATSSMSITSCAVEAFPEQAHAIENILIGWFPQDTPTFVAPYINPIPYAERAQARLDGSILRYVGAAGVIVLIFAIAINWLLRRKDFALMRVLHLDTAGLLWIALIDALILLWIPVTLGSLLASVFLLPAAPPLVLRIVALQLPLLYLAIALSPLIALIIGRQSAAVQILKE